MYSDVRWIQRFQIYEKALARLQDGLSKPLDERSDLEQEGVVQRFEYTYELAWKLLKEYLEHSGMEIAPLTPRSVIKEAFAAKLIEDGDVWMDMLTKHNLTSPICNEETFRLVLDAISRDYFSTFEKLHAYLKAKVPA